TSPRWTVGQEFMTALWAILRPLQEILGLALIPELHVVYSEVELQSLFMS
uniref:Uncharacterized protein n=1 Tax=Erpetoichthys calabaricus TaxID=27687 RepID=A0A8C4TQK0_ERPCA